MSAAYGDSNGHGAAAAPGAASAAGAGRVAGVPHTTTPEEEAMYRNMTISYAPVEKVNVNQTDMSMNMSPAMIDKLASYQGTNYTNNHRKSKTCTLL